MRDPLSRVSIKHKLGMTFVLLTTVSLGIGGTIAYYLAKYALLGQILDRVATTTQARAATVSAYLD